MLATTGISRCGEKHFIDDVSPPWRLLCRRNMMLLWREDGEYATSMFKGGETVSVERMEGKNVVMVTGGLKCAPKCTTWLVAGSAHPSAPKHWSAWEWGSRQPDYSAVSTTEAEVCAHHISKLWPFASSQACADPYILSMRHTDARDQQLNDRNYTKSNVYMYMLLWEVQADWKEFN